MPAIKHSDLKPLYPGRWEEEICGTCDICPERFPGQCFPFFNNFYPVSDSDQRACLVWRPTEEEKEGGE